MKIFHIVASCTIGLIVFVMILFAGVSEYHWFETKANLPKVESDNTEDRNMTSTARKSVIANPNYAPKALVDASPIDFLAPMPASSISFFNGGDKIAVITQEDVESMSAEELRNFGILLNIITSMNMSSGKIIKTCGEKLLPRFFKPETTDMHGKQG